LKIGDGDIPSFANGSAESGAIGHGPAQRVEAATTQFRRDGVSARFTDEQYSQLAHEIPTPADPADPLFSFLAPSADGSPGKPAAAAGRRREGVFPIGTPRPCLS
jgi:hypothetical protein